MSNTAYLIAQANANEVGETLYGAHGDQKGFELNARQWYSYPWDHIYRAKNEADREKIALFMERAVSNGFVGYDTNKNKRDTLFTALTSQNTSQEITIDGMAELNENCSTDCSALGFCAVYAVTHIPFSHEDSDVNYCPRVRHYEPYMTQPNVTPFFEKLEGEEYTTSSANLLRGDILVALGHHIGVWI